jgi:hypothetical protein
MRNVLETTLGNALYRKRQATVEPVFANTSSTAVSTASNAAADPPAARNGDSSPPPTTSSSSTATTPRSQRPERTLRPHRPPLRARHPRRPYPATSHARYLRNSHPPLRACREPLSRRLLQRRSDHGKRCTCDRGLRSADESYGDPCHVVSTALPGAGRRL